MSFLTSYARWYPAYEGSSVAVGGLQANTKRSGHSDTGTISLLSCEYTKIGLHIFLLDLHEVFEIWTKHTAFNCHEINKTLQLKIKQKPNKIIYKIKQSSTKQLFLNHGPPPRYSVIFFKIISFLCFPTIFFLGLVVLKLVPTYMYLYILYPAAIYLYVRQRQRQIYRSNQIKLGNKITKTKNQRTE